MPIRPFRFIHASDFHLEQPMMGVAEIPDHLREMFLESPYLAARQVFEAVLAEDAKFLILSGGIVSPDAGPRGPAFLVEQFTRLAERGIEVYWAGSAGDPPDAWPASFKLPKNVHCFSRVQVENLLVQDNAGPLARLAGISSDGQRPLRPGDFLPDSAGLYSIAVAHGEIDATIVQTRGIQYWAMGGRHDRGTPFSGPHIVHYCGTPQGRRPQESGAHGCTLVQVDEQGQTRTSLIPTDSIRWLYERLILDDSTTRDELESRLRERMHSLRETMPSTELLISWIVGGRGPLLRSLRHGKPAADLLQLLRADYGYRSPPLWSVAFDVELSETFPPEWYEQETIRGDFLREIRQLQMNPGTALDLAPYLAESHLAGTLAGMVAFAANTTRDGVLREAAALGVDLLSGEEPKP